MPLVGGSCVLQRWTARRSPCSPRWQSGAGTVAWLLSAKGGVLKRQALAVPTQGLQLLPPSLLFDVLLWDSLTPIQRTLLFSKSSSNWLGQKVKLYVLSGVASSGSQMEVRSLQCCGPDPAKREDEHASPSRSPHTYTRGRWMCVYNTLCCDSVERSQGRGSASLSRLMGFPACWSASVRVEMTLWWVMAPVMGLGGAGWGWGLGSPTCHCASAPGCVSELFIP